MVTLLAERSPIDIHLSADLARSSESFERPVTV